MPSTPTSHAPLRRLLARPTFRRWAVANLFARLPLTMALLALVLVGERLDGSLAVGAVLAGVSTFTAGLTAQWRGRMLDRVELRQGLRRHLLLASLAAAAIAAGAAWGAPVWAVAVLTAAQGVASAAVLGGFRALLVPSVPEEEIEAANAMDAVFLEVAFVAGPALAGALALAVGAIGVIALMSASFAVAAVLVGSLPRRDPQPAALDGPSPWRLPGARSVYALAFGLGLSLGGWEATMPVRVTDLGLEPATAGPLLALTALGSGLAGLAAAAQRDSLRRARPVAAALMAAFAVVLVSTGRAPTVLLLGIALFAAGLPIAPLNALGTLALQRLVPRPRHAEGFALLSAVVLVGAGTGQALSGVVVGRVGASTVILALAAPPALCAAVVIGATLRRRRLGLPLGITVPDPADTAPDARTGALHAPRDGGAAQRPDGHPTGTGPTAEGATTRRRS